MKTYADLLRTPGVARILVAQLAARFPGGLLSIGLLIHIEGIFHSYGAAGIVLGALSIGQAVSGPLTARWMGVWGIRPVLVLTSLVCATALTAVALLVVPLAAFAALALLVGLSFPPIQPAVRTIYPKIVTGRQLSPLFSLDATAQEIIWIAGPVVVTFVATQVSSVAGILLSVFFILAGGAWFISSPEVGRVRIPRSKRRFGVVLTRPPVVFTTIVGLLVIGSFAATEAGVVATFGDHGNANAGIVLAIWSVASFAGGLAFGHLPIRPWTLARRLLVITVGVVLASFAWEFWTLTAALVVAGICIAPALAVMSAVVAVSVRFSDTAEAYGWVGTGQLIGVGIGSAVAGFAIDGAGPVGAFWVAGAFVAAGTLVAIVFHRIVPDLRGRDASPIPDTEPVPIQPPS